MRGFTLLELLVALVVLGFLLAGLSSGARFGLRLAQSQARISDRRGDLDAVERSLRRIVAQASPRAPLRGTPETLALVSTLPVLRGQEAEIGVGVDAGRRLLLRWRPHLSGEPLGPPPPPQEVALLTGVAGLELSYWSAAGGGRWSAGWSETALPDLVRLRVRFPTGDARSWPDLVVAPMRQRPRS